MMIRQLSRPLYSLGRLSRQSRTLKTDESPFSEGHANNKAKSNAIPGGDSQSREEIKKGRDVQDPTQSRPDKDATEMPKKDFQPGLGKGSEQVGTKAGGKLPHEGKIGEGKI